MRALDELVDPWRLNTQTASYTLVAADAGRVVEMNVATANNLTVPLNSSVAYPVGTEIRVIQYGAGATTIVATGGVTLNALNGVLVLAGRYAWTTLVKRGTDEWDVELRTQSGLELAYAELSADPTAATTTLADISGLSITFTAPSVSFMVEGYLPTPAPSAVQPAFSLFLLTDSANVELGRTYALAPTAGYNGALQIPRARLPRVGGTAYPITPGNSYTFKIRAQTSSGTCAIQTNSGLDRPHIRAVTC